MSDPRKLNRFGSPEMTIAHKSGFEISVTQCEAYADAAIQRAGLVSDGMPDDRAEFERVAHEKLLPHIFEVLLDAGEISLPPAGTHYAVDGPECAKMLLVGTAVGSILGFNGAANKRFGKGEWTL
ncbi:MAG: hypothetical protein JWO85_2128 [Candidatus Eremiobacteraeota bacterium]|nr:hypothetical protein [Candidatus Eremiobacteraeota bacterium]